MAVPAIQLIATDRLITRDRLSRNGLMVFYILFVTLFLGWLGSKITHDWFDYRPLGGFIGLGAAAAIFGVTIHRFLVRNRTLQAFVTIDLLRSFFKGSRVYVSYGPGLHAAFPWESRSAENNVLLDEASQDFQLKVQCKTGIVEVKGSIRMRPDICRLVPFLSGVAVMAEDITDLVKSFIITILAKKDVGEALESVKELNDEMTKFFGLAKNEETRDQANEHKNAQVSDFEERFGVNIGDVTIAEILPSAEAQKTRSAIDEAQVIAQGAAIILGYDTVKKMLRALKDGILSREDVNRARREFMAASENITMNLDANEHVIRLENIDPEVVKAIGAIAPAIAAWSQGSKKQPPKKRSPRKNQG